MSGRDDDDYGSYGDYDNAPMGGGSGRENLNDYHDYVDEDAIEPAQPVDKPELPEDKSELPADEEPDDLENLPNDLGSSSTEAVGVTSQAGGPAPDKPAGAAKDSGAAQNSGATKDSDKTSKPRRPRRHYSDGARWHMSSRAVDLSVPEVIAWTEDECLEFLIEARFGSRKTIMCPHCNTVGQHYWRPRDKRWKCSGCGSTFSITSRTVFADRKRPLKDIVAALLMWANSAGGQPALELKRHLRLTYNTAFTWQHKVREALVRGFNVGILTGDLEVDGAHQAGRRSLEKRGKPQGSKPVDPKTIPKDELQEGMEQSAQTAAEKPAAKKANGNAQQGKSVKRKLPKDRRILISVRARGPKGKGAFATRVAVGLTESPEVVGSIFKQFVAAPESFLNTDTMPAYLELGKKFKEHRMVEHAETLVGKKGENNNQAEEYNWRYDRTEKGVYLNIEPKYLLDYAVETAFRSDTRRLPNSKQLKLALNTALTVGESEFWRGYTKGRHRTIEFIHPKPRPAKASGPPKKVPVGTKPGDRPPPKVRPPR